MRVLTTALLSLAFLIGYVGNTNADDPTDHPADRAEIPGTLLR